MALAPLILTEKVANPSGLSRAYVLPGSSVPLNLLLDCPLDRSRPQWLRIIAGSLLLHLVFFLAAIRLPSFIPREQAVERVAVRRVPLYLPPDMLTQREPNRQKVSKTIDLADLRPARMKRFDMPRKPTPKQTANTARQILPEAPNVAVNQATAPLPAGIASGLPRAATPPPPPDPGPFQNVGSEAPLNPNPTLIPKTSVQAAIQALAQNPKSSHTAISDDRSSDASPRIPGSIGQPASPHAAVELQSDPQGTDFKPYLTRILAIVRANWRRVVPESARIGALRGRTVMEFIINRDGTIPKIVTADSSGSDPLDRAALAGLSMSNPLPPLPADYKGFQVRLAFTFSYNLPTQ